MTRLRLISPLFARMKIAAARLLRGMILCALVSGCSVTEFSLPALLKPGAAAEARTLDSIFENYFEAYLDLYPSFATEIGDHRYDDQLEIAISTEHISAQRRLFEHTLSRLAAIDRDLLDPRRRLFLQVLERNLKVGLEGQKFNSHLVPVRQLASMAVEFPLFGSGTGIHPFRTVTDYDNFLKRMEQFETWIDTAIANLRRGMAAGHGPAPRGHRESSTAAGKHDGRRSEGELVLSIDQSHAGYLQ